MQNILPYRMSGLHKSQTPVSPWPLNFVQWRLIFVCLRSNVCRLYSPEFEPRQGKEISLFLPENRPGRLLGPPPAGGGVVNRLTTVLHGMSIFRMSGSNFHSHFVSWTGTLHFSTVWNLFHVTFIMPKNYREAPGILGNL